MSDQPKFTPGAETGGWPGYHEWWTPLPTNDHVGLIQKRIEVAISKHGEVQS